MVYATAAPYVATSEATASLPLDHDNYWYGVLAMDIPSRHYSGSLRDAAEKDIEEISAIR